MTAPTPDLAEWLLQRISEDEAKVQWMRDELARARQARLFPLMPVDLAASSLTGISIFVDPDRWAAECAAKRQIVHLHNARAGEDEACGYYSGARSAYDTDQRPPCTTLLALAAPYQSDPSFDPAWTIQR